jgi:hypothetical protein
MPPRGHTAMRAQELHRYLNGAPGEMGRHRFAKSCPQRSFWEVATSSPHSRSAARSRAGANESPDEILPKPLPAIAARCRTGTRCSAPARRPCKASPPTGFRRDANRLRSSHFPPGNMAPSSRSPRAFRRPTCLASDRQQLDASLRFRAGSLSPPRLIAGGVARPSRVAGTAAVGRAGRARG